MQPRIFAGKKGKNNELILKALYEKGYLTPWEIAREIAVKDLGKKPKVNLYHKMQKINSVLVRKKGRLADLLSKEFIEKAEKGYCLTFYKGFCSALILYEIVPKPAIDEPSRVYEIFPELKEVLDITFRFFPEAQSENYGIPQEIAKKLLEKGLNFESISNSEFNTFFYAQSEEMLLKELKKERKNEQKRETPPELKESIQKFLSRIEAMCMEQFKELSSLKKSLYNSKQQNPETD
jgi:hypothetical protein